MIILKHRPFFLCLNEGQINKAKLIYNIFKEIYMLNFHFFIVLYIINELEMHKTIESVLNFFQDLIDMNNFNPEQKRSILHCIFLYLSDEKNVYMNSFIEFLSLLQKFKIDISIKDQFNRNALFYLFLSENDNIKMTDPYEILKFCLSKFNFDLNDVDIFGHNLLYYAIQSKADQCIYLIISNLMNNGDIKNNPPIKNENSVYS